MDRGNRIRGSIPADSMHVEPDQQAAGAAGPRSAGIILRPTPAGVPCLGDAMRLSVLSCLGVAFLAPLSALASPANALPLPDKDVAALAREVNGEMAMQTLEGIVQQHRERGSRGYH